MTLTVKRTYFKKQEPKIISYRDYKNFSNDDFRYDLINELSKNNIEISKLDVFVDTFLNILNKKVPVKKRHIRANQAVFIHKIYRKHS